VDKITISKDQIPAFKLLSKRFARAIQSITQQNKLPRKSNREDLLAYGCGYTSFSDLSTHASGIEDNQAPLCLTDTEEKFTFLVNRLTKQVFFPVSKIQAVEAVNTLPQAESKLTESINLDYEMCSFDPSTISNLYEQQESFNNFTAGMQAFADKVQSAELIDVHPELAFNWEESDRREIIDKLFSQKDRESYKSKEDYVKATVALWDEWDEVVKTGIVLEDSQLRGIPDFKRFFESLHFISTNITPFIPDTFSFEWMDSFINTNTFMEFDENKVLLIDNEFLLEAVLPSGNEFIRDKNIGEKKPKVVLSIKPVDQEDLAPTLTIYSLEAYLCNPSDHSILAYVHGYLTGAVDNGMISDSDFYYVMDAYTGLTAQIGNHMINWCKSQSWCDGVRQIYTSDSSNESFLALHVTHWEVTRSLRGKGLGADLLRIIKEVFSDDSSLDVIPQLDDAIFPYDGINFITLCNDPFPGPDMSFEKLGLQDKEENPELYSRLLRNWQVQQNRLGDYMDALDEFLEVNVMIYKKSDYSFDDELQLLVKHSITPDDIMEFERQAENPSPGDFDWLADTFNPSGKTH
jgi:hypothetical protein